jgi:hypothetical protein
LPNRNPELLILIPTINATVGRFFSYTVAEGSFVDPDKDALVYTLFMNTGKEKPDWVLFDPTIPVIKGIPPEEGEVHLKVVANDGREGKAESEIIIEVRPVGYSIVAKVFTVLIILAAIILVILIILIFTCLMKCK